MKIFFMLFVFSSMCFASDKDLTISLSGKEKTFTLKELKSKLAIQTVTIEDPVYKKQKTYDGFKLIDIFNLAGFEEKNGGDELIFTAVDGYAPNTSFENLNKRGAILVFREHGKKDFQYEKFAQGKTIITMSPYYVVWIEPKIDKESVPWPYQLVKIEVVNFKEKYEKLYPKNVASDSSAMKGFLIFKNQCLRCHSINLEGGDLGPELNAPKNVTEYWAKNTLKSFIQDASSFRYKSKMPSFPHLKEEQVDQIIQYFETMKNQKILNAN